MQKNIPNIITITRLILIFPYSYLIYINYLPNKIAFIILIILVLTDFLDGYIARKYKIVSNIGKLLDPIADKSLIIMITLALLLNKTIPLYSLFIFIRDIVINTLGIYLMKKQNKIIGSNIYGKTKTVLHFLALSIIILLDDFNIIPLILLIIGFITIIPELIYGIKIYKKGDINEKRNNKKIQSK